MSFSVTVALPPRLVLTICNAFTRAFGAMAKKVGVLAQRRLELQRQTRPHAPMDLLGHRRPEADCGCCTARPDHHPEVCLHGCLTGLVLSSHHGHHHRRPGVLCAMGERIASLRKATTSPRSSSPRRWTSRGRCCSRMKSVAGASGVGAAHGGAHALSLARWLASTEQRPNATRAGSAALVLLHPLAGCRGVTSCLAPQREQPSAAHPYRRPRRHSQRNNAACFRRALQRWP